MKFTFKNHILTILIILLPLNFIGQVSPPPILPPDPPGLPVDSGLWILLISSIYYGIKKTKK